MRKDGPAICPAGFKFMYIIKVTDTSILIKKEGLMKVYFMCGNNVIECPGDVDRFHYKVTNVELISNKLPFVFLSFNSISAISLSIQLGWFE